jgi:hypothetical protein
MHKATIMSHGSKYKNSDEAGIFIHNTVIICAFLISVHFISSNTQVKSGCFHYVVYKPSCQVSWALASHVLTSELCETNKEWVSSCIS